MTFLSPFVSPSFSPASVLTPEAPAGESVLGTPILSSDSPAAPIVLCIASPYCVPAQEFHSFRCVTFQRRAAERRGDPYVQKDESDLDWITR